MLAVLAVQWTVAVLSTDIWDPLRRGAEAWASLQFDTHFAINVGDENGRLFSWETPGFSMDTTHMKGASLSKWPSAIMISGLVANGTLRYDDLASKYLPWWSTNPKDPRSRVTLRHLLSFRSGYMSEGTAGAECMTDPNADFLHCAEKLYQNVSNECEPGQCWAYLSCHLQFAGAMAVAASGQHIQELYDKYLYKAFNMTSTTWTPYNNPQIAAGITTTANDFENMLHRLLTYKVLPMAIYAQMETDYSQPPVTPSGDGWFGHYAMGHWWECLGYGTPHLYERFALPAECMDAHIQAGPGMFGYYPLLDRSGGGGSAGPVRRPYYFQVALQESLGLSGIPEYLRILAKPIADAILAGENPDMLPRDELIARGAGLLQRDLNDIASALGTCTCAKEPHNNSLPYKALTDYPPGLPADEGYSELTRFALARLGQGIIMRDLVAVADQMGECTCEGRPNGMNATVEA